MFIMELQLVFLLIKIKKIMCIEKKGSIYYHMVLFMNYRKIF